MSRLGLSDLAFLAAVTPAGSSYDSDAQTYITAVETADAQSLETAVKDAINSFVVGCKSDGIWTAIKASCILAGARTLNGALVPLVGTAPTNVNNNFVSGDYNRKTGLKGNGSTKCLDSNRANNADPQDSNHNAVYATQLLSGQLITANTGETGANTINYTGFNTFNTRNRSVFTNNGIGSAGNSLIGISRSSSSGFTFRSNATNVSAVRTSSSPGSTTLVIFGFNNAGPTANTASRLAFYSIGESLDLALLDSRVETLLDELDSAIP